MHNSESWAHRSLVAVAQKVAQVIKQTVENQHFYWRSTSNIKQILFDEVTYFVKIAEEIWASNYLYTSCNTGFYTACASLHISEFLWTYRLHWDWKDNILLASESYTCTEWILSAPLTSSGLTPQFVHINYIPKCVWIALVHTQGLLFQRHANVFHSETPLSGPLLTARATV